ALRVFPQIPGTERFSARLPCAAAPLQFLVVEVHVDRAVHGVDGDYVAVLQERDRTANGRFRSHMADAETARRAREAPVGDERKFVAHALAVKRRRRREHLAHARSALWALVADDQHLAFLVLLVSHRLEAGFFAVEAARGAGEL